MAATTGRPTPVVIGRGTDQSVLLTRTLSAVGAWRTLRPASDGPRTEVDVCVLVASSAAAPAEPALVRHLLRLLHERGLTAVLLGALPRRDRDAGRTVREMSERLGYPALLDPYDDTVDPGLGETSLLHGQALPQSWVEARRRVVVASCATDARHGFALSLDALACLARPVPGADEGACVAELLRQVPPHLVVLDATVTSDGVAGSAVRHPVRTDAIVSSRSALLVDFVGAALLGLDVSESPVAAACLADSGLPDYRIIGAVQQFSGVRTASPTLRRASESINRTSPSLGRVLDAALVTGPGSHQDDTVLRGLRDGLAPWRDAVDQSPLAQTAAVSTLTALAGASTWWQAWRTSFDKDSLPQVTTGLGIDLADWVPEDYEAAVDLLHPTESYLAALPSTADGLRWAHVDGAVVFEASRVMRASYPDWVARVEIAEAISMMADYLGGRRVVVSRDEQGRPLHQAERNVYLPQPNYLAFSGGQQIDVCKLEVIRYSNDDCGIWWRTISSPNGSADVDDGSVEFSDSGGGRTLVTVRGRQRFTLPAFWRAVDLDQTPELRDALTEDAYRRFFAATLDNFAACFEGRSFRIGRPPETEELASLGWSRLLASIGPAMEKWVVPRESRPARRARTDPGVDEDGFRHVRGNR
ncbi:MAG TPA: hypothetical protein VIC82_07295 [Candidatus Nanopelagicales bacterium]|jgi:hypothetical protein